LCNIGRVEQLGVRRLKGREAIFIGKESLLG